jgi:hypothetical protein
MLLLSIEVLLLLLLLLLLQITQAATPAACLAPLPTSAST